MSDKTPWSIIQIDWITQQVSELVALSVDDIRGKDRSRNLNTARKIAMALSYRYTRHSYERVGKYFDRNHATVMHADRTVEREIKDRGELLGVVWSQLLERITNRIEAPVDIITESTLPMLSLMVRGDVPTPSLAVIEAIVRYVEQRAKPGHFVTAVLANDLKEAVGRADACNAKGLAWLVAFIYNNVPSNLWGTYDIVRNHLDDTHETLTPMDWSTGCAPLAEHFRSLFAGERHAH